MGGPVAVLCVGLEGTATMPLGPRRWKEHHAVASDPELPIEGHVEIPVPIDRLWEVFSDVGDWPTWNPCFWTAHVRGERLERGAKLVWAFNPIKPWYLYKMPATARIVECVPGRKVTWDAPHMRLDDGPADDPFLRREYRPGWSL